jgi:hypothetical protein
VALALRDRIELAYLVVVLLVSLLLHLAGG